MVTSIGGTLEKVKESMSVVLPGRTPNHINLINFSWFLHHVNPETFSNEKKRRQTPL